MRTSGLLYSIFCVLTAIIGYHIHHNAFWAVINFLFAPLTWLKWLICHDVTLSIIKESFTWFFK